MLVKAVAEEAAKFKYISNSNPNQIEFSAFHVTPFAVPFYLSSLEFHQQSRLSRNHWTCISCRHRSLTSLYHVKRQWNNTYSYWSSSYRLRPPQPRIRSEEDMLNQASEVLYRCALNCLLIVSHSSIPWLSLLPSKELLSSGIVKVTLQWRPRPPVVHPLYP